MIYSYDKKNNLDPEKEDFRTSTIIGMMLYLPDSELWEILRDACFKSSLLPVKAGKLQSYDFWPHWDSKNTSNTEYVEPDAILEFEKVNIIIEAKRYDEAGQNPNEWKNELIAYNNEYKNLNKAVFLIALGGNSNDKDAVSLNLIGDVMTVIRCSWIQLQRAIRKQKKESEENVLRVLDALLLACDSFGFRDYLWLDDRFWVADYAIKNTTLEEK